MKLTYCQEEILFEQAVHELMAVGMEQSLVQEAGKILLYQSHFERYPIASPDKDRMRELVELFLKQQGIPNHEGLDQWLTEHRQSRHILMKRLAFQEQLRLLKRMIIPDSIVQDTFIQRKHQFDWILFALIETAQEGLLWELYYQIQHDGQSFEALARQYSHLASATYGGVEEPVQIDALNPETKQKLMVLQPGEITEPFTLDGDNYAIARLIRTHSAQLTPQLEASIREELFSEWTKRQLTLGELALQTRDTALCP